MTQSEWNRRKEGYSSYQEYLDAMFLQHNKPTQTTPTGETKPTNNWYTTNLMK